MKLWVEKSLGTGKRAAKNLLLIVPGCVLMALSINGIALPLGFLSGGFSGLAVFGHYLYPALPVSLVYLVLNLPLFILGYRQVNRRFFFYSVVGAGVATIAFELATFRIPISAPIPAAILAGIIMGVGGGLVLRSQGSAGGSDILSVVLMRKFSLRLGTTFLSVNIIVLAAGAFFVSLEKVIYTLIFMFVTTQIVNLVVTGFSQRKAILIITRRWEKMRAEILRKAKGATVLNAQGAYTGRQTKLIYTVVSFSELGRVKDLVRKHDPEAFVVVSDTLEVMNPRIGNQPHW